MRASTEQLQGGTSVELRAWLDGIAGITRKVNEAPPLKEVLDLICMTTCELAGFDFSAILMPDEDRRALLIAGSHGIGEDYIQDVNARRPMPIGSTAPGEAPTSRAFRFQRPIHVRDLRQDASCSPWGEAVGKQGNRSLLCLPLITSRGTLGVLNCYSKDIQDILGEFIFFMETIANQASLAIESASLRAKERGTIRRLDRLNGMLRQQQSIIRRCELGHQQLMKVALEDGTLRGLAVTVAEVTECDVVIVDRDRQFLATACQEPDAMLERYVASLEEMPQVPAARGDLDYSFAVATRVRCGSDSRNPGRAAIAVPVLLQGEPVSWLWAAKPRQGEEPSIAERRLIERAAVVIALIMSRERMVREATWRDARDLLNDLVLRGDSVDESSLLERGLQLGLDLGVPHVLIVLRLSGRSPQRSLRVEDAGSRIPERANLSRCRAVLKDYEGASIATGLGAEVIVLHSVGEGKPPAEAVAAALARRAKPPTGADWNIAISPVCSDVISYPKAYEAARRALALIDRSHAFGSVIDVRRLGVFGMLLEVADSRRIRDFASGLLEPLITYDAERGADLLATLRMYLDSRCSAVEAAKKLFVHTNTIRYRVQRIEQLLGRSLSGADTRLELTLALLVADLLQFDGSSVDGGNGEARLQDAAEPTPEAMAG